MGGQLSASGSFQSLPCTTNADWMSALCPLLWDVPLHHLSIPGSHDTMTYCLNKNSPISQTQSRLLQLLDKVLPCVTRPLVLKWSTTQVLNVTEQLDAGVRYLDLRIAHMLVGSEKNLHFVHMVYTTVLVEDTLTEISEWLESHPREVVILACRNFEGMTEDLHEYLVACIKNIFGDMLCPRGEVPTLRQLWARGQQVIVSYEEASVVSRHAELWPGIPYWWGDQVKAQELIRYLERMKSCGRPGEECRPRESPVRVHVGMKSRMGVYTCVCVHAGSRTREHRHRHAHIHMTPMLVNIRVRTRGMDSGVHVVSTPRPGCTLHVWLCSLHRGMSAPRGVQSAVLTLRCCFLQRVSACAGGAC
ncbi:PI-PLC X domain-containing protein 1-like isoform X2 [Canis lupus baileyi]|nr:PI-PLC X domain-containing protein 1 isoform X3 [Canis lupus familiaris]XP_038305179.1 PI-PLC X domain-containing protein 1 isoform X3 [Canis lupus familiaris]XP_038320386.1 PI-PLC X domain-containing protein 1 isoform X3 [Canis lupus familiaris]XP_038320387.1 PI-PLC X domain-containing protein 1 isoform X3 [Canis lupus familiaris]